jgi:hypothetical protein
MDLEEIGRGTWAEFIWPWVGEVVDLCDAGNESFYVHKTRISSLVEALFCSQEGLRFM